MSTAAWECLHKATLELAKSSPLKQRLTDAFTRHLIDMPAQDLPGEVREDFEALRQSMTRIHPEHGESAIVATVRKMSPGEADACAARIIALLDTMHRTSVAAPPKSNVQGIPRTAADTGTSRIPTLISINRA